MRRALEWMMVAVLFCAARTATGQEQPDARLLEAQQAFDDASSLERAGRTSDAIVKSEHALALREAVLGGSHRAVSASLGQLGGLLRQQGKMTRAEPLLQRALSIQEASLGRNHPDVAIALGNLAILYTQRGLYAQAEPLLRRALHLRETTLGKHHPDIADSLNSLANLYSRQGLYVRAEPLYEHALVISEAALGRHHPNLASLLNNLANLYFRKGLYTRAEQLHERALAIKEASFGAHHPSVTHALTNLANLYSAQGLYARAELLHKRALSIREAAFGQHHPDVALLLNNLAVHYLQQGAYAKAGPLLQRALGIWEATFGKHHPGAASILNNLAHFHLAQHRLDDAVPLLTRAFSISEHRLRQEALDFSEHRLTAFLQLLRADEESLYALLRAHPEDARVQRLALTSALLRKGRSAEELASTSRAVFRSLSAQDRNTFERLRGLRAQLAQLSVDGPGSSAPADYQQRLERLAGQGDDFEADLARRSAPLRSLTALPLPADIVDRVAAALPPDSALIELIAYEDKPLIPEPGTPLSRIPSKPRYLALVLLPDARIRTVDLGSAAPIDRAAAGLRDAMARRDGAYRHPAQALWALAFQPLLPLLGDVRRLFLSPDGQLGLIPFAALHDGQGFLVDSFDISYLTSGKDLLPRARELPPARSVFVLADPTLDASWASPPAPPVDAPVPARRFPPLERATPAQRTGVAQRTWPPLPGTRREAEAIQRLLPQAQLLLGPDANRQQLFQLAAPSILHIATHGFFLEDVAAPGNSRALGHFGAFDGDPPAPTPLNPLLRSGLILSGARASPAAGASSAVSAQASDYLVTALELTGLDLWGTELVVLSACDTGRGDVRPGQGVYGLRRAFVIAGAETVVMSLWKVNDDSTHLLMEGYYRHLLAGRGRAQALREAMRTLRESRPHPYDWAPFIALGSDAPLRLSAPARQSQADLYSLPRRASPGPR